MSAALGEHDRQLSTTILLGVVVELDELNALVRVDFDGLVSDWLRWSATRAGPGVRTWDAPEVGEQVVVVCPYGDPAQGIVVASVYQEDFDQPANLKTKHRTQYADGTVVEYDRETHAFLIDVGTGSVTINCATATVVATTSVTLDTPTTHMTGDLAVVGGITAGQDITTPAEVMAGEIGLKTHKHPTAATGPASSPIP